MDFGFDSFESSDFEMEIEDFELVKTKKMDRNFMIGEGGSIMSTPVVHEGMLYFGSADNYVYAVDAKTGKEVWKYKTGGKIFSIPAISDGMLFIGSYDKSLYAITLDGKEAWRFQTGGEVASSPCVYGDLVLAGSKDGYLYAVDRKTGRRVWSFRTGDWVVSSPVAWNNRIYIGSYDGNFYCLSAKGKELWRFRMGAEMWDLCHKPFISDGVVYFASMDGYLYALDAGTGKEIWKAKTAKYGNAVQPIVYGDIVLQPSRDAILYAFTRDGKELWRFRLGSLPGGPLVYNDTIYIGDETGAFYAISLEGKELWRFMTGGKVFGGPAVWNNRLFFGSYDCRLYSLDMHGKEIWSFATSNLSMVSLPPPHDAFELKVKKSAVSEDAVSEDKYRKKKGEESSLAF